jgi:protein-L-isoaspartate(D-aspartate) O-methyltransferase
MVAGPGRDAAQKVMMERQLAARGIRSAAVLDAMRSVPREAFVPLHLEEFAYQDSPLPIEEGQTISQPYIVAYMIEALELEKGDRVLEIGTGSGYAAAVLAEIAGSVHTVERYHSLAEAARARLDQLGYRHVHVIEGDGTEGYPDAAPYDAIVVAAGGPRVPESLRSQLAPGGRLIIPIGPQHTLQKLVRVRRTGDQSFDAEELASVRFVPLVGVHGWQEPDARGRPPVRASRRRLPELIGACAEPFTTIDDADIAPTINRIGDARVVLLGEATHGTSEFYRMRARITQQLIENRGFNFVAVEADWPDAARVDHYVRHFDAPPSAWTAFARFPTWMWRNEDVGAFVDWLHDRNERHDASDRVGFYGLDLYSLFASIEAVLGYLDDVDPAAAEAAREHYGCLTPWQADPATYGHAALTGHYRQCEAQVVKMLSELLSKRAEYDVRDGERYFDAVRNARLVQNAERYYRAIYYGAAASWNLRDGHMFETLEQLLEWHGPQSKAVIWAHNSHLGDATYTEMAARGEHNLGQLCREQFKDRAYLVGFGTHAGRVAAASRWGGEMKLMNIRASHPNSYEQLCHASGITNFFLPLKHPGQPNVELIRRLSEQRLERAIGVIYRPDSELASHYFRATLPRQFDEYIWIDTTSPVSPLDTQQLDAMPDTYPFGT